MEMCFWLQFQLDNSIHQDKLLELQFLALSSSYRLYIVSILLELCLADINQVSKGFDLSSQQGIYDLSHNLFIFLNDHNIYRLDMLYLICHRRMFFQQDRVSNRLIYLLLGN